MLIFKKICLLGSKAATILIFLLTIGSAFGGKINPHIWATPSVLTLALQYFAILTLILTAIWFMAKRWIIGAAGILTLIICWGPIREALPLSFPKKANGTETFTLLTYNILHAEDISESGSDYNRAISYIINSGADIVCLQEFQGEVEPEMRKASQAQKDSLKATYKYIISTPNTDLTLMSKYPATVEEAKTPPIKFSYDIYRLKIGERDLTILNLHLTPYKLNQEERNVVTDIHSVKTAKASIKEFKGSILSKMKESFRKRSEVAEFVRSLIDSIPGTLIVCGDFNDVPASYAYNMIKGDDLRDAYTETNFGPVYTFDEHFFLFHIDQILYRGDIRPLYVKKQKINTSDHSPLFSEFEFTAPS